MNTFDRHLVKEWLFILFLVLVAICGLLFIQISYDDFRQLMEGPGGFVYAGWCGGEACEQEIKTETKATIRVLPDEEFRSAEAPATCLKCGRAASAEAVWARAY